MANEILLSPGVSLRENDQSQITEGTVTAGLALVGPTVKGRANIPTLVTSYSDYQSKFGDSFESGSNSYEFLTSLTAYNYFQQGGDSILVTRVTSGSYTSAESSIDNNLAVVGDRKSYATASLSALPITANKDIKVVDGANLYRFIDVAGTIPADDVDGHVYFYATDATSGNAPLSANLVAKMDVILGSSGLNVFSNVSYDAVNNEINLDAAAAGTAGDGISITTGNATPYFDSNYVIAGYTVSSTGLLATTANGVDGNGGYAFTLETIAEGVAQNNFGVELSNGVLPNGTQNNIRWEVVSRDLTSGTFSLVIRRGDDTKSNKSVLETFSNLSLDPNSDNYVEKVIGNYKITPTLDPSTGQYYLKEEGEYSNKSRYVRVKEVLTPTFNYLDSNGVAKYTYATSSPEQDYDTYIPTLGSGSFAGATGDDLAYKTLLFDKIGTDVDGNTQGLHAGDGITVKNDYIKAISLLSNTEEFKFQLLATPGLLYQKHANVVNSFITACEERGDCFYVVDLAPYGTNIATVASEAGELNTSYAAAYYPWIQMASRSNGKLVWAPASTVIPGVYAFNDRVAAEWFAPAGMNRGGIGGALRAERKLSTSDRDTLYNNKINAIATFPGVGLVAYGQKTLQTQASALDRINVRRLMIALKRYIGDVANTLLFEQNTIATRNNFLSQVNPYLESVQQKQGLYAYKVVMDDTNNTSDVIDRNQLVGQIYIQPTKTIEYIYLTFNITPTGVSFE